MRKPGFSIIIPTKNRERDLIDCLKSIAKQTLKPLEIIIIDATPDIGKEQKNNYTKAINSKDIKTKYQRAKKPGLPSQRNQGLKLISNKSKYVIFLDDDVILEQDYCSKLLETFYTAKNVVGVSGVIVNQKLPLLYKLLLRLFLIGGGRPGSILPSGYCYIVPPDVADIIEVDFLSGGTCCYKLSAIKNLNFDPEYEKIIDNAYCEDLDFSIKASKRGKLLVNPKARLWHKESPFGRADEYRIGIAQVINRARLAYKMWGKNPYHWFCFVWAIWGQIILNLAMTTKGRSIKRTLGNLAGIIHLFKIKFHSA